ncbi:MAG: hypothetical protein LCH41_14705 [Armatimonadetes bacterium]|nr:hypothetical protein [Armatimonadota bacterium]
MNEMTSLRSMVLELLHEKNGLTDGEIAHELRKYVPSAHPVALVCRQLETEGLLKRIKRLNKPSANYITDEAKRELTVDLAPADEVPLDFEIPAGAAHLGDLHKIGFVNVGDWSMLGGQPTYFLTGDSDRSDVLYALVLDGAVVCLGHSVRSLNHTMNSMVTGSGSALSQKWGRYVKSLLSRDKKLEIWMLADNGSLKYAGHRISLTAGIYRSLLEHFTPVWNRNFESAA